MNTKTTLFAALAIASALFAWTGCKDDDHDHEGGGHDDGPVSCKEITDACHHVDQGTGPIHDCHEAAHASSATEESCGAVKADCISICTAAAADGGEHGEDGGD